MSISFEEAVDSLSSMFPTWDRDTLEALLSANENHLENTIENIFSMQDVYQTSSSSTSNVTQGQTYMDKFENKNNKNNSRATESKFNNDYRENKDGKRGIKVTLPDDFLRPPSFNRGNRSNSGPINALTIGDEQLALMLQNEIFKNQVESTLGNDFMQGIRSENTQRNRQQSSFSNQSRQPSQQSEGIPDMGILKGLSSMGEAAKRSLTQLALQFSNSTSSNTNNRGSSETRGLVSYQGDDDDDDESEVINFDTNVNRRGAHTLSDPSPTYNGQQMRPRSNGKKDE